jgi:VWFA-related protein
MGGVSTPIPLPWRLLLVLLLAGGGVEAQNAPAPPQPAVIDVVAVDRDGRFVEDLRGGDFTVTVDGVRRPVLWVHRISRGGGAMSDALTRRATAADEVAFGAERERDVFVLIDEASMVAGDERAMVQAASLFLDRLGLDDRVAVLRLPLAPDVRVSVTTERAETRVALAQVAGRRLVDAEGLVAPAAQPASVEPDRMTGIEADRPVAPVNPTADLMPRAAADSSRSLRALFDTLRTLPGRKVVVIFSAGLPTESTTPIDDAAIAAASARATVYAFGLRSAASDPGGLTTSPLERLAAATGGVYASLGKNPERLIERTARELGACYVIGIEQPPAASRPARRALRLETARKGVTLKSAAWLVPLEDNADRVLAAAPRSSPVPSSPTGTGAAASAPARPRPRDPELDLALVRLFAYADAYERECSLLVAEEDYKQTAAKGSVRTRSDLLLVRFGADEEWVSFRDVYEVDGRPIRDREERLRRLFLEATPEARARMDAIRDESARYNLGVVGRTVNVPLLPLTFLRPANRGRFEYDLDRRAEVDGVETLRIRYEERVRPTIVGDGRGGDQPVSGWYVIDELSGAIIETRMEGRHDESRGEIVVRYRRDAALGLWVPAEMRETYSVPSTGGVGRFGIQREVTDGRATYSNFRRFQVRTEEKLGPPK